MTAIAPILITNPWAHGTTASADVVIPVDTSSNTVANQVDGFPPSQEQDPLVGGEYVKRAEMNGVFKLYSLLLNFINQGGQFTFNPAVVNSGGYDAGVILYCAPDNTFQRSLINGNVADFITNSSFRNDGINWSTAFKAGDIIANKVTSITDVIAQGGSLYSVKNGWSFISSASARNGVTANYPAHNVQTSLITTGNLQSGIETTNSGGGAQTSRIVTASGIGNRYKMQTSGSGGSTPVDGEILVDTDITVSANISPTFIYTLNGVYKGVFHSYTLSGEIVLSDSGAGTWLATIPFANIGIPGKILASHARGAASLANAVFNLGTTGPLYCTVRADTGANEINIRAQFSGAGASNIIVGFSITFLTN